MPLSPAEKNIKKKAKKGSGEADDHEALYQGDQKKYCRDEPA